MSTRSAQFNLTRLIIVSFFSYFLVIALFLFFAGFIYQISISASKAIQYHVDPYILIKPTILLLPSFLTVIIPFASLIASFLTLDSLTKNSVVRYTQLYRFPFKILISSLLAMFTIISLFIFITQEDLLSKYDGYFKNEIRQIRSRPLKSLFEPGKIFYVEDYAIYPMVGQEKPNNGQSQLCRIYQWRNFGIIFACTGEVFKSKGGDLIAKNVSGFSFNSYRRVRKKIYKDRITLIDQRFMDVKAMNRYISIFKELFTSPSLPLSNYGHKYGYPHGFSLWLGLFLQKFFWIASPLIIFLFLLILIKLGLYRLSEKAYYVFFVSALVWSFSLLLLPMFTEIHYHTKPSFHWLYLLILAAVAMAIFVKVFQGNRIRLPRPITIPFFTFLQKKSNCNYFSRSQRNWNLLLAAKLLTWVFQWHLFLLLFLITYRAYLYWKLNKGMDQLFYFLWIQLLNLSDLIFIISPYLIIIIVPFFLYRLKRYNIYQRQFLAGRDTRQIVLLTMLILSFWSVGFFMIKEVYGNEWKEKSQWLHQKYMRKGKKDAGGYIKESFRVIAKDAILFYQKNTQQRKVDKLSNIMIDSIGKKQLILAQSGVFSAHDLLLEDGLLHSYITQSSKKFTHFEFQTYRLDESAIVNGIDLQSVNTYALIRLAIDCKKQKSNITTMIYLALLKKLLPLSINLVLIFFLIKTIIRNINSLAYLDAGLLTGFSLAVIGGVSLLFDLVCKSFT